MQNRRHSAPGIVDPADLAGALSASLGPATIEGLTRLSGGASRETWRFDAVTADGARHPLVLRRDPPGRPSRDGGMTLEAVAIRAAGEAGLRVPEVLASAEAPSPWDTAGIVMRAVEGETIARHILRGGQLAAARARLTAECGEFLAGLHAIEPARVPGLPAGDPIDALRSMTGLIGGPPTPTFELAFRWLEAARPPARADVVVHGDFRLGNLVVGVDGLRAVLDWELVHLGSPAEDLGWLCTKAWRFGGSLPVGGFGTRDDLLASYRSAGGADISLGELRWWEVLSTLKWGLMCIGQADAHLSGAVRSVELAAIGRRVCEQEWDLLLLLCPDVADRHRRPAVPPPSGDADLHGRPTAAELLDAVEEYLRDDVVPGTKDRLSFHARVAANAVAIARRELAAGPALATARAADLASLGMTSEQQLAEAIASGAFADRTGELHDVLAAGVAAKLAVANPTYLASR